MKGCIPFFILFFVTIISKAQVVGDRSVAGNNKFQISSNKENIKNSAADQLGLKELEFDFGKIPQGKPVIHVFEVINNGTDSLKINNVQASCGCTTPDWERNKVLAPAQKTTITVGYNAASEGSFTKSITITYNGDKTKQLLIKGEVWVVPLSSAPENKELTNLKD